MVLTIYQALCKGCSKHIQSPQPPSVMLPFVEIIIAIIIIIIDRVSCGLRLEM